MSDQRVPSFVKGRPLSKHFHPKRILISGSVSLRMVMITEYSDPLSVKVNISVKVILYQGIYTSGVITFH